MHEVITIELKRECAAVQIPAGVSVKLPQGTAVDITQRLGGTCTVRVGGALFRIAGKDADALGLEAEAASSSADAARATDALDERQIWEVLRTCYDPEIPVNIVDLGLVYDLHLEKLPSGGHRVGVRMTLTAPGCGMGTVIAGDAQQKILLLDGVEDASVEIVWDPAWHQSMISSAGRRVLGLE